MTTYTQKLRASIAYNTDQCYLECEMLPEGVQPLQLNINGTTERVDAITMEAHGALIFYRGTECWEYHPSENDCHTALDWINQNINKLFPEQ